MVYKQLLKICVSVVYFFQKDMSRNLTTESSCSSNDELRKKIIKYRHKFLESFVLDVDDRAQKGHLVSNPVQHNDLDKRLLSGLRMAQQEKKSCHI